MRRFAMEVEPGTDGVLRLMESDPVRHQVRWTMDLLRQHADTVKPLRELDGVERQRIGAWHWDARWLVRITSRASRWLPEGETLWVVTGRARPRPLAATAPKEGE